MDMPYLCPLSLSILPNFRDFRAKNTLGVKSPSLKYYSKKYTDETSLRVRFSALNLSCDESLLNIPLYFADEGVKIIIPLM